MKFLFIALLGITTAFAQSEPVTRIKGDNDASFKIAPNLKVPYKQSTITSTLMPLLSLSTTQQLVTRQKLSSVHSE